MVSDDFMARFRLRVINWDWLTTGIPVKFFSDIFSEFCGLPLARRQMASGTRFPTPKETSASHATTTNRTTTPNRSSCANWRAAHAAASRPNISSPRWPPWKRPPCRVAPSTAGNSNPSRLFRESVPEYRQRKRCIYPVHTLLGIMATAHLTDAPRGQKDLEVFVKNLSQQSQPQGTRRAPRWQDPPSPGPPSSCLRL